MKVRPTPSVRSRRTPSCVALGVVAWGLATPAWALDPQYRQVTLVDGRVLTAEILSTEPQGLLLAVPQGRTLISFELLLDMVPISSEDYAQQEPWVVYYRVADDLEAIDRDVEELLNAMPGIERQPVTVVDNSVNGTLMTMAVDCDVNIVCIADVVKSTPWKWVLTVDTAPTGGSEGPPSSAGAIRLQSKLSSTGGNPLVTVVEKGTRDELWDALHAAIGLEAPAGGAPNPSSSARDSAPAHMEERKVVALSFVPFPGVPSLVQGDTGGFALALAVVVPSTAVWVGAVGQSEQSYPAIGAMSFAGYYAVTVLANQVAGFRSMEKRAIGISAMPTAHGGGVVVLAGEL